MATHSNQCQSENLRCWIRYFKLSMVFSYLVFFSIAYSFSMSQEFFLIMEETASTLFREINLIYYLLLLVVLPLLFVIFRHSNLPPGPFPWPVIGNILSMGSNPHISLAELATTHGPLMSLRLGTQLLIVASSRAAATEILRVHDQVFSARCVPHAIPALPNQLHLSVAWADCTDQWKYLRALCRTELFSAKVIESQASTRDKKATELVEFVSTMEGTSVKIGEVTFATVFNSTSTLFVSKDFISLKEENNAEGLKGSVVRFLGLLAAPNLADYFTILSGLDLQGLNKKAKEIYAEIRSLWEVNVIERRNNGSNVSRQTDFLDSLLEAGLTNDQISYLIMELFFAATDTSTSTIEWAMAELIKNPEAMRKVRVELEKEIKGNIVKEADLPYLPYLHSVIKETLRLHPPVPFLIPHRASEACNVMNYTVPKDSQVFVNVWAIGRDPNIWDDPVTFKPERFLESSMDLSPNNFTFLPFGAGRRICPGIPMAAKQVPLILACLINCFDWSLPDDLHPTELEMDEKFGMTLHKEKPLVLIPKVKQNNI